METTRRLLTWCGEFRDAPGFWKMDIQVEGESGHWSVVRKPDSTWWYVKATHDGVPGGPALRVDLDDQIADPKLIEQLEEHLVQAQKKWEETMKEGDRVRVIRTGTTGVVKGFGSAPGVPKLVNVAYDGGGGCNHMPEELDKIGGFTPTPR
jgi:hypothetical protein